MNSYDVIIVGAGNGGLVSALLLIKEGFKVLLLDEHNMVGGLSKYSKLGRFEFGNSIHNLYLNDNSICDYKIKDILEKCGIEDEICFSNVSNLFKVVTKNQEISMPFGIDEYIKKVEELVPGSYNSVKEFFDIALECREAMKYINDNIDNIDYTYIKQNYYNFMKVAGYSVSKVMDTIGIPLSAQEIINVLWVLLGSSETEISFVTYSSLLLNMVENGYRVPTYNNYEISLSLANSFLVNGGELKLNSKVVKLLVEDNKINGVKLEDGTIYYSNYVIVNSTPENVYGKLIDPSIVPRRALKSVNKREIGGRSLTINIGLNRSAEELGLDQYMYFLYQTLDSDVEYARMKELLSGNQVAIVHNNANSNISPVGTCSLSLTTVYFDDCFGDYVDSDRYFTDVREISKRLIDMFEKFTKVKIREFIEEIEIVSPINVALFNDNPEGCTYGNKLIGLDDMLPRMLNYKNENYVDGLYLCGGFDGDVYGYSSSFVSGLNCKNAIMKDIKGE